jgi:hypothetical protein
MENVPEEEMEESTVEASIEVLKFFPDFRDNRFVVVLRLFEAIALFPQSGYLENPERT